MSDQLWIVRVHEDDFDYDFTESVVVWAGTPDAAERTVREAHTHPDDYVWSAMRLPLGPVNTRLIVEAAPTSGIVHVDVHPG